MTLCQKEHVKREDKLTILTFDVTLFRQQFPAFADPTVFPDALLQMYWDMATCYISNCNYGWLNGDCRVLAINMMTAHLVATSVLIAAGQTSVLVQGATVDKVTVSLTPPPLNNQWQWWLSTTPYGQQLFALLQAKSVGGLYIGGSLELAAFRRVGGFYPCR
jgi:Protein of unknown function (DUF4054)